MGEFKCEKCGSTDFVQQNGMYVCQYCGAQYPIETNSEDKAVSSADSQSKQKNDTDVHVHVHVDGATIDPSKVVVKSPKSWGITLVLSFFFGMLGFHRFYAGKIGTGVIWLFTGGVVGVGWIVDFIMVLLGRFKDSKGFRISMH